jgi:hypothetical protein
MPGLPAYQRLSTPPGSGLCVAREPHLPRTRFNSVAKFRHGPWRCQAEREVFTIFLQCPARSALRAERPCFSIRRHGRGTVAQISPIRGLRRPAPAEHAEQCPSSTGRARLRSTRSKAPCRIRLIRCRARSPPPRRGLPARSVAPESVSAPLLHNWGSTKPVISRSLIALRNLWNPCG